MNDYITPEEVAAIEFRKRQARARRICRMAAGTLQPDECGYDLRPRPPRVPAALRRPDRRGREGA